MARIVCRDLYRLFHWAHIMPTVDHQQCYDVGSLWAHSMLSENGCLENDVAIGYIAVCSGQKVTETDDDVNTQEIIQII